jgi:hypothetical protein
LPESGPETELLGNARKEASACAKIAERAGACERRDAKEPGYDKREILPCLLFYFFPYLPQHAPYLGECALSTCGKMGLLLAAMGPWKMMLSGFTKKRVAR